ncbi:phosphate ABC transporter substrate-binding protein PstS [Actinomadura napierensis]|uniref:Phosphate-binding protein n=1 Tax=Actinomadura napierensis TaxID=267854 RepID=A0ABN3AJ03_9ACTN
MKNGSRLAALGGVVVAGALALSACGSDDNNGGGDSAGATSAAAANIDCAKGAINAAGSSAQKNAIEEWTKVYTSKCSGANINYNPSGSGAGVQAFTSGQVAFAGSDSALKPEEHGPADARCKAGKAIDLPMVPGPIAVVYKLNGVDGLQLSPKTLAGIFAGKIKKWDDPAIAKENSGAKLPSSEIKTLHRSDDSGTSDNFTKYLKATAADVWSFEPGKKWVAPGGQGLKGSDGISTALKQTEGSISYVELSFASNNKLQTAKLQNGAGEYTEISPESASKAVEGAQIVGTGNDLALKLDYGTKVAGAYPLVLVTYEIACEKGLPAEQAAFVKSFLTYISSPEGQQSLTAQGYAPLPANIATKVRETVKGLS